MSQINLIPYSCRIIKVWCALKYGILWPMNSCSSSQRSATNHLLRIVLVVLLVLAAWHVATHELDHSGSSGDTECQVCRLNHVPFADFPVFAWALSLFLACFLSVTPITQRTIQSYRYTLGARAPPLF